MSIEKKRLQNKNARWLMTNWENMNFDLAIQRKANIWTPEQESLLIHSIVIGDYIPELLCTEEALFDDEGQPIRKGGNQIKIYHYLDGVQRMNTLRKFWNGEFALIDTTPNVDGVDIAGCKFEDLSQEMQDIIATFSFSIIALDGATEEDKERIFFKLNNGTAMSGFEKTRAKASGLVMEWVGKTALKEFFAKKINMTDNMRKRYTEEQLVLQCLSVLIDRKIDLTNKEMEKLAIEYKDNGGIPLDIRAQFEAITDYLNEAFPEMEKFLQKLNVPMVFKTAGLALADKVAPVKFAGCMQKWFTVDVSDAYKSAKEGGTANYNNVFSRNEELQCYYTCDIKEAPDYKLPSTIVKEKVEAKVEKARLKAEAKALAEKEKLARARSQIKGTFDAD